MLLKRALFVRGLLCLSGLLLFITMCLDIRHNLVKETNIYLVYKEDIPTEIHTPDILDEPNMKTQGIRENSYKQHDNIA